MKSVDTNVRVDKTNIMRVMVLFFLISTILLGSTYGASTSPLETKRFDIRSKTYEFIAVDSEFELRYPTSSNPFQQSITQVQYENQRDAMLKAFFKTQGIAFDHPDAFIHYDNYSLYITNTPDQLEKVAPLLRTLEREIQVRISLRRETFTNGVVQQEEPAVIVVSNNTQGQLEWGTPLRTVQVTPTLMDLDEGAEVTVVFDDYWADVGQWVHVEIGLPIADGAELEVFTLKYSSEETTKEYRWYVRIELVDEKGDTTKSLTQLSDGGNVLRTEFIPISSATHMALNKIEDGDYSKAAFFQRMGIPVSEVEGSALHNSGQSVSGFIIRDRVAVIDELKAYLSQYNRNELMRYEALIEQDENSNKLMLSFLSKEGGRVQLHIDKERFDSENETESGITVSAYLDDAHFNYFSSSIGVHKTNSFISYPMHLSKGTHYELDELITSAEMKHMETFLRIQEKVNVINFEGNAVQPEAADNPNEMKTLHIPLRAPDWSHVGQYTDDEDLDPFDEEKQLKYYQTAIEDYKRRFEKRGVNIDEASIDYDGSTLIIRATAEQIQKIKNDLRAYRKPGRLQLDLKFEEENQTHPLQFQLQSSYNKPFSFSTGTGYFYFNSHLDDRGVVVLNTKATIHRTGKEYHYLTRLKVWPDDGFVPLMEFPGSKSHLSVKVKARANKIER